MQAYKDQASLVRVAQAQVEACEDELTARATEMDALQVNALCTQYTSHISPERIQLALNGTASCLNNILYGMSSNAVDFQSLQARLAEAEDGRRSAEAAAAAAREEGRQATAALQAEAQAAQAGAKREADAEIAAAHAEGAGAAARARQEAESAIAEVRAGADATVARARQEADSSSALIRWVLISSSP